MITAFEKLASSIESVILHFVHIAIPRLVRGVRAALVEDRKPLESWRRHLWKNRTITSVFQLFSLTYLRIFSCTPLLFLSFSCDVAWRIEHLQENRRITSIITRNKCKHGVVHISISQLIMSCQTYLKADLVMICLLYIYVLLCSKFLHLCAKIMWIIE